jgi:hypothetical protein
MTRLILTTDDSGAGCLKGTGLADIVIWFGLRFTWGPLPSDAELATFLEARSTKHGSPGSHWLDFIHSRHLEEIEGKNLGLIDLCERCETIELWVDPEPNAQLTLIWLLDYLRHHGNRQVPQVRLTSFPATGSATKNVCSVTGRSDACWTDWLTVRRRLCPASRRGRSHCRCTTTVTVTSVANGAS